MDDLNLRERTSALFDEILDPFEAEDEFMSEIEYILKLINEQLEGINDNLRELDKEAKLLEILLQDTADTSEQ